MIQQIRGDSGELTTAFQIGGQDLPVPQFVAAQQVVHVAPVAPAALPTAAPTKRTEPKRTTRQIVAELNARLRIVEREIKNRSKLEQERDQIKRLIAAARPNNLHRMKVAG